jgi:tRNA uridine 5-carbamoylmethylation protein Kti12
MNTTILDEFIRREVSKEVDRRMAEVNTRLKKASLTDIRKQCIEDINRMTDGQRERLKRGEPLEFILYGTVQGIKIENRSQLT